MNSTTIVACVEAVHAAIVAQEADIESLDRAIGDGDHYLNIRRGCTALMALRAELQAMPPAAALQAMGMKLLSTVGGASGPLIGSLFMAMGMSLKDKPEPTRQDIAAAFAAGVDAVQRRGQVELGDKTMLDVLLPVARLFVALAAQEVPAEIGRQLNAEATRQMLATRDMIAVKGRAAALGERARGHIDPGCKTCEVAIAAVTETVLST